MARQCQHNVIAVLIYCCLVLVLLAFVNKVEAQPGEYETIGFNYQTLAAQNRQSEVERARASRALQRSIQRHHGSSSSPLGGGSPAFLQQGQTHSTYAAAAAAASTFENSAEEPAVELETRSEARLRANSHANTGMRSLRARMSNRHTSRTGLQASAQAESGVESQSQVQVLTEDVLAEKLRTHIRTLHPEKLNHEQKLAAHITQGFLRGALLSLREQLIAEATGTSNAQMGDSKHPHVQERRSRSRRLRKSEKEFSGEPTAADSHDESLMETSASASAQAKTTTRVYLSQPKKVISLMTLPKQFTGPDEAMEHQHQQEQESSTFAVPAPPVTIEVDASTFRAGSEEGDSIELGDRISSQSDRGIGDWLKNTWNKAKNFVSNIFKPKPKPTPPKPPGSRPMPPIPSPSQGKNQTTPQDVEDCTGCKMVWMQVEMDVGNARFIEDVQSAFEHNCMDAQKSLIFYETCEDMYDDMYAMVDDYMSNKFNVDQMCARAKMCQGGGAGGGGGGAGAPPKNK